MGRPGGRNGLGFGIVPFDRGQLRLEKVNVEMAYDAAFTFWDLRGVVAERWAHGPVFGGWADGGQQINLNPSPNEEDTRLVAAYGLKATAIMGEGALRAAEASTLAEDWFRDVTEVLRPQRVVRLALQLFGLYPITDPEQASRRLRSRYYRNENLAALLPQRLRANQDRFHAAVDMLILHGDEPTTAIVGVVGPPHAGTFFNFPDEERDTSWWMGLNMTATVPGPQGIPDPEERLDQLLEETSNDFEHVAHAILPEVVP
jgi:hypothetical protein